MLYIFVPGGVLFSLLPGFLLPIKYVGFPAKPDPPLLTFFIWMLLPIGLSLTAVGHRMTRGEWRGIGEQLHARAALTGLAFVLITGRYLLAGFRVPFYPAGVLLVLSAGLMISRLLVKSAVRNRHSGE